MTSEQNLRQQFWMTGMPALMSSPAGIAIGQRVPWFGAIAGGILGPSLVVSVMLYLHAPSDWLCGFVIVGGAMWLLLITYVWWLWRQPPIVEFDSSKSSITIPRLRLSLPLTDIERFDLVDGTCADGEGGRYPVVALRLSSESYIFVTNRKREFRDAWTAFTGTIHAAVSHSSTAKT